MSHSHEVKPEEARSWAIEYRNQKPVLISSGWVVGYTPGHKSTPIEAVMYEVNRVEDKIEELKTLTMKLIDLIPKEPKS